MMITTTEHEALSRTTPGTKLSIYLPTYRHGPDVEQNRIRLKNLAAQGKKHIDMLEVDRDVAAPLLAELEMLDDDHEIWRHSGSGLALFADRRGLRSHTLATSVEEFVYVGARYCLRPLLPSVNEDRTYHILAVSQDRVRLFECTHRDAHPLDVADLPTSLPDALGHDVRQKSLQFHTGAASTGKADATRAAVFHGHGSGSDEDNKEEIEQFLRLVDDAVVRLLTPSNGPLVLAAVDYVAAIYANLTKYSGGLIGTVSGNPDQMSADDLHRASIPIAGPALAGNAAKARERLAEQAHSGLVEMGVERVLPAVDAGRVEALHVTPDEPIWGEYDRSTRAITLHPSRQAQSDDLLDLAIARAIDTGAEIYAARRADLPDGQSVAATLRY